MASSAQEARFRELASRADLPSVARVPAGRDLALVCRNDAGELVEVEVIDVDGQALELERALIRLGGVRRQALREAELAMTALVALIAVNRGDSELNLTTIAREADASKQTLYNRLERERVAA